MPSTEPHAEFENLAALLDALYCTLQHTAAPFPETAIKTRAGGWAVAFGAFKMDDRARTRSSILNEIGRAHV